MDLQDFFVFMNPNERWRRYRKLIHSRLNKQSAVAFHAPQQQQAKLLLKRLLDSSPYLTASDKLDDEFNRTIASTAFDLVYGYPLETAHDPFLIDTKTLMDNIMKAAMPSNFLVNALPWLAYVPTWVPGTRWKRTALEWRDQKDELTDTIYDWTKERVNAGMDEYSLMASALKDCKQAGYDQTTTDEFSKRLGIAMYGGATDTLVSALLSFVLAMVLFPEVQTKAQQEIDMVIGQDRLPTAEDRPHLLYVERMVHEIIRWQPPAPLGSEIARAMTRDENTYKNPDVFDPDRFLDPTLPPAPAFGWGRRVCPGAHFTHAALFVFIASILATFDVKRCKDESGRDIIPSAEGASNSLV
ncbi:hypothetical protein FRC10_007130 [Ceratobasidium sp. 414]|nr:hypothetical protein FRC10_007130 [Ceratobasidium sp. 414]